MARGGGKHLKNALASQQSRLKAKDKASHAAQVQVQKATRNAKVAASGKDAVSGPSSAHGAGKTNQAGKPGKTGKPKGPLLANLRAQALENGVKGKGKAVHQPPNKQPLVPFTPTDRILLIGEGNFSFALALISTPLPASARRTASSSLRTASLATWHIPPVHIIATAYDSEAECFEKYSDAEGIVAQLREKGVTVLFGVDGTKLHKCPALKGKTWDRIVWNFPHAGKGISDQDRNILTNQILLLDFLASTSKVLAKGPAPTIVTSSTKKKKKNPDDTSDEEDEVEDVEMDVGTEEIDEDDVDLTKIAPSREHERPKFRGTVLVTLRNVVPYTSWDLPRLAKSPPAPLNKSALPYPKYTVLRSFQFHRSFWKGYEHRMTKGERGDGKGGAGRTGEGGEDRCWEFYLADVEEEDDGRDSGWQGRANFLRSLA